ncbi:MAG: hypothetical protein M1829_001697 [Trizodia sp. TS-e1964]|nr:MAG: hypothetical protein M1829_001697 [Trizodia sp. TS-e1964]
MLCAISGEAPQVPVASRKSGNVFERRLIEEYIAENGKDPVTGEELSIEDIIDLKSARIVRPRPPTLTSIPSLLSVFQNEWDALALQTFTLQQQLAQTRQELSTALYQQDAAVRVIARIMKERDDARDALSKVTLKSISTATAPNESDQMQVDGQGLPQDIIEKIDEIHDSLCKTRRKRIVPDEWASVESIQTYSAIQSSDPLASSCHSLALNTTGQLAITGGENGSLEVFSISKNSAIGSIDAESGAITDSLWCGNRAIISTTSGVVKVFENGTPLASFNSHAGQAMALALHPTQYILASVGVDKSYAFYDLRTMKLLTQIFCDSALSAAAFHPDGQLFAAGGADGLVKLFEVKTGANATNFQVPGPVAALSFSENGIWLAAAAKGQTSITIWDLRKSVQVKELEIGSPVDSIAWDFTGQYLATAGPSGITVQHYSKASKEWSEPLRSAVPATDVEWGLNAGSLVSVSAEGVITVLGQK